MSCQMVCWSLLYILYCAHSICRLVSYNFRRLRFWCVAVFVLIFLFVLLRFFFPFLSFRHFILLFFFIHLRLQFQPFAILSFSWLHSSSKNVLLTWFLRAWFSRVNQIQKKKAWHKRQHCFFITLSTISFVLLYHSIIRHLTHSSWTMHTLICCLMTVNSQSISTHSKFRKFHDYSRKCFLFNKNVLVMYGINIMNDNIIIINGWELIDGNEKKKRK